MGHAPAPGTTGIDHSTVRELNLGAVSLWISDCARPAASTDAIRAHNRVVEAAMTEAVTPVPLRFGQWSADADALAEAASGRIAGWCTLLEQFAGAVEFGLRVIEQPGVDAAPQAARVVRTEGGSSGRAYLESLKTSQDAAARQRVEASLLGKRVDEAVDALIRRSRVEPLWDPLESTCRHASLSIL